MILILLRHLMTVSFLALQVRCIVRSLLMAASPSCLPVSLSKLMLLLKILRSIGLFRWEF